MNQGIEEKNQAEHEPAPWGSIGLLFLAHFVVDSQVSFLSPLLPLLSESLLRWPLLIVWGGMTYGVYALSLTLLGERFRGTDLVAGNAAFAVMWGVGGILGPLAGGSAMDAMGPQGLPLAMAAACLLFVVLAVYRQGRALWRNRAS